MQPESLIVLTSTKTQTLKITISDKDHWLNVSILQKRKKNSIREREGGELALMI